LAARIGFKKLGLTGRRLKVSPLLDVLRPIETGHLGTAAQQHRRLPVVFAFSRMRR